jgi:superfamily II DNA/RNA helicase
MPLVVKDTDVAEDGDSPPDKDQSVVVATDTGSFSSLTLSKTITQIVHVCATHKKPRLLIKSITKIREQEKEDKLRQPGALLIFCTKIKTLKFVEDFLRRQQVPIAVLHGQLPQAQREKTLNDFKCVST